MFAHAWYVSVRGHQPYIVLMRYSDLDFRG